MKRMDLQHFNAMPNILKILITVIIMIKIANRSSDPPNNMAIIDNLLMVIMHDVDAEGCDDDQCDVCEDGDEHDVPFDESF